MGPWRCRGVGVSGTWPNRGCRRSCLGREDFLDCVVFYFDGDDHKVILMVIMALKIVFREGYEGHATSVMKMGDVVDGLDMVEVSLPGG